MLSPEAKSSNTLRSAVLLVAALYVVNFGLLGFLIGPFDYDHLSGYYELAWRFWRTQRGLPHYDPFLCGGRTLGGDPQIPIFHPLVLLVPLLGPALVLKLEMLAQLALGTWALVACLERFGAEAPAREWGVLLFLAGGGIVSRFLVGHVTLGFFFLYPLFLHLSYRLSDPGPRGKRLVAYGALFVYAGFYKPNFLIYGAPPLLFEAAARSGLRRDARPLLAAVGALAVGALVGAVSWLPAWKYFSDFPRVDDTVPSLVAPYALVANLLLPLKAIPEALYGPGFMQRHEYNLFLGPVALWIAWRGMKAVRAPARAEKLALFALLVFCAWLGLGAPRGPLGWLFPFRWLVALWPGFHTIRVPTRFWFGTYLGLCVFSALGFRPAPTVKRCRLVFWLGVVPLIASAAVNLSKTSLLARQVQWSPRREYPATIRQVHAEVHSGFPHLRRGESVLDCFRNLENHQSDALQPGDTLMPLRRLTAEWEASWIDWHRIRVRARGKPPYPVWLNFNHSPYWRFEGTGGALLSRLGQPLALQVQSAALDGELVFEQPWERAAARVSAASALAALALALWLWRRDRRGERE